MPTPQLTDADLIGITGRQITQAVEFIGREIAPERRRNLDYYHGRLVGDMAPSDIEGRSSVISSDVSDTVEWMLPSLVKTFTAGDDVVEFSPRRQEDEASAKQATEYCNYVLHKQNPGFGIVHDWIKDALLQRNGVLKVWWDDGTEDVRETYRGLTDEQAAMLLDQPEVEAIEHTAETDPIAAQAAMMAAAQGAQVPEQLPALHTIVVRRRKPIGQVRIENVPAEEFLIDRRAKSIETASFVAHRLERSVSDLRAAGYENIDDIGSNDDTDAALDALDHYGQSNYDEDDSADEAGRMVWVTECYLRIDYNGDGITEWRQVVRCGGVVLRNVECDGPPFVTLSPIRIPHRFFGICPADQAIESQRLKTSLLRASLDGLYHSINGRTFAVDGQVNLDDLLTSRPGGVVRVKTAGAVGPLMEGRADLGAASAMLEYAEVQKENRTGFTRYSQGTNADALNQTAQGMNIITNRSDSRIELIARVMAETGFRDLFKRILQLVSQHQDKATMGRVNGEFVNFDPRGWSTQFDFTVNTGLGTGNKDQTVQHLMMLGQAQEKLVMAGLVTPRELFNSAKKLAEALGYKQPELFFADPAKMPPKPPAPNPEQIKAQAQQQIEQAKLQGQMQLKQIEAQMQQQTEIAAQQAQQIQFEAQARIEAETLQVKAQFDAQLEAQRLEFDRYKADLDAQTRIIVAQIQAGVKREQMAQQAEKREESTGAEEPAGMEDDNEREGAPNDR
jgi:hypothetical protein